MPSADHKGLAPSSSSKSAEADSQPQSLTNQRRESVSALVKQLRSIICATKPPSAMGSRQTADTNLRRPNRLANSPGARYSRNIVHFQNIRIAWGSKAA